MTEKTNQPLGCAQGDTYDFSIDMSPMPVGTTLVGAHCTWYLLEGAWHGSALFLTKPISVDAVGFLINGHLDPADTALPVGSYFWQCKLILANGDIYHPSSGPFELSFAY